MRASLVEKGSVSRLGLSGDRAVHVGDAYGADGCAIPLLKILVAVDGAFRARFDDGPWHVASSVIVAPNQLFAVQAEGVPLVHAFLAPHLPGAQRFIRVAAEHGRANASELERRRLCLRRSLPGSLDVATASAWLTSVEDDLDELSVPPVDGRIEQALAATSRAGSAIPSIHQLAASVNLSADRFSHLFSQATGVAYRQYALLLRAKRALAEAARTGSLTAAAHAAGFADLAHFTRNFRRMIGTVPSQFLRTTSITPTE